MKKAECLWMTVFVVLIYLMTASVLYYGKFLPQPKERNYVETPYIKSQKHKHGINQKYEIDHNGFISYYLKGKKVTIGKTNM